MYVLLVLLLISAPLVSGQHNKQPQKSKYEGANSNPTPLPSPAVKQLPAQERGDSGQSKQTAPAPEPTIWGLKRGEFVQSLIAAILVVVTSVYAGFTFCMVRSVRKQAHIMKRQLAEMRNMRRNTVAEMQAAGTKTQEMIGHLSDSAQAMKNSATLAKESADAAKDNASAARSSAESLKSSQRAHLDWELFNIRGSTYVFQVSNYGSSMARVVEYALLRASFDMRFKELPDDWVQNREPNPTEMTIPGHRSGGTILEFDIAHYLSDEQRDGSKAAIFGVRVDFIDIFGERHFMEIAFIYRSGSGALENLPKYNRYE